MDPKSRTARETLIYEALRFANWAAGEGICPVEGENAKSPEDFLMDFSNATNDEDWDTLADRIAALSSAAVSERERDSDRSFLLRNAVTRVSELEAENARLRADRDDFKDEWQAELEKRKEVQARLRATEARVAELDKAVFDIQIMSVASAACFTNAQLENILTMIERAARRVREGGKVE